MSKYKIEFSEEQVDKLITYVESMVELDEGDTYVEWLKDIMNQVNTQTKE